MLSSLPRQAFALVAMLAILTTSQNRNHRHVAVASAAPIPTPDNGSNFGSGVSNAANNWDFPAAVTCLAEVAVSPVLGDYVGDHVNNCMNGNVIDHNGA